MVYLSYYLHYANYIIVCLSCSFVYKLFSFYNHMPHQHLSQFVKLKMTKIINTLHHYTLQTTLMPQ
jgi:hypothetical protein